MDFYQILYDDLICLKDDARHLRFSKISTMYPWQPIFVFYGQLLQNCFMDLDETQHDD